MSKITEAPLSTAANAAEAIHPIIELSAFVLVVSRKTGTKPSARTAEW
jgi:hypothetical protein